MAARPDVPDNSVDPSAVSQQPEVADNPQEVTFRPPTLLVASALTWRLLIPIGIVLLIFIAFMPALDAGFVDWDDDDLLLGNTRYRVLDADSLRWMFTTSLAGHFQPLTWLSYWFDFRIWRGDPFGFHLTNVVLHTMTAIVFYFVVRRLLIASSSGRWECTSLPVALSAALAVICFACHPLRAESVAWIAERRDVLGGFCYVCAVAAYLRYAVPHSRETMPGKAFEIDAAQSMRATMRWYVVTLVCCAISLLAKASAVTLAPVLLVLDWYPLRRLGGPRNWFRGAARWVWVEKLPLAAMAVVAGVRAIHAQREGGALATLAEHDGIARIAQACYGLTFYVWKTICPTDLGPLYQMPSRDVLLGTMFWRSVAIVLLVGFVIFRLRRRVPAVTSAFTTYVLILFPVLGFAQSGPQIAADRYSYLSCMGFAALIGGAVMSISRNLRGGQNAARRALAVLGAAVFIALLVRGVFRQSDIWQQELTLWERGVEVSPRSSIAHVNFADALARTENYAEAAEHYRMALELHPNDAIAWHHFGDLHVALRRPIDAIPFYTRAIELNPGRRTAYYPLARALLAADRPQEAVEILRQGTHNHPNAVNLVELLSQLLSTHGDSDVRNGADAVAWAHRLRELRGTSDGLTLLTLATALAEDGRFEEAVEIAELGLEAARKIEDYRLASELERRLTRFRTHQPYHIGAE